MSALNVTNIELITQVGKHHEYRERPLPAYVISYEHKDKVKAYVSKMDEKFQTVRHQSWRWFDFLWMTHIMDYFVSFIQQKKSRKLRLDISMEKR